MPPRASLKSFLATARSTLKAPASQRPSPLTFVVGNESADLDSLCCAILYAYLRSHAPPHSLHIPLANLPRADLGLRTEMTAVLHRVGLAPADLPTLCELPAALPPRDTRWLLVDHNALTGPLRCFAGRVVGCVDHHVDEGVVRADARPRVVEPCGSCMSLVVDECRPAWDALSREDPRGDDDLVRLGLAAILLDTVNLTAADKVKEKDTRAVRYLAAKMRDPGFALAAFFDDISAVKEDISDLSFRDILRKDYKEWYDAGLTLGVSAVVQGFPYLLRKAQGTPQSFPEHVAAWAAERSLDVAAVMTASNPPGGEFQRHLLVWGRTPRGRVAAAKFADIARERLRLETWQGGELDDEGEARFAWRQGELAASRKQVAPLLREAIKMVEKPDYN
ncbi:putative exopolyphosphatase [Tolypocladium ophioglossoides CBS 100239]|uniref:Putative exopolyphosphatase n=1 Tax=Tolypocladium ophioglossoides (strain CBS 100239) TaxID=1163406 RepID=A0A0L0MZK8_TOLOC|nr:putative exopolyphosphatase [Tolypocladium ophioglossoides CBS 100239]